MNSAIFGEYIFLFLFLLSIICISGAITAFSYLKSKFYTNTFNKKRSKLNFNFSQIQINNGVPRDLSLSFFRNEDTPPPQQMFSTQDKTNYIVNSLLFGRCDFIQNILN